VGINTSLVGIVINLPIVVSGKQLMIGHSEEQVRSGLNWIGNLALLIPTVQNPKEYTGKPIIV
jgi:hypothetical protein